MQQALDLAGDFADLYSDPPVLFDANVLAIDNSHTPGKVDSV